MTSCGHNNLILLPAKKKMLRCRHCHLKIKADEVDKGFCPECFESRGEKRYDFDEMGTTDAGVQRYRCEDCGIIIE